MYRESWYEVIKDLVAEDLVAMGVGPQVHGNNPVPGGPLGAWGVLGVLVSKGRFYTLERFPNPCTVLVCEVETQYFVSRR